MLIRELPEDERPRERLLSKGAQALSDAEVVAVLLRSGCAGRSAIDLARDLLSARGGIGGLLGLSAAGMRRRGLGDAKAASILAALEMACRLSRAKLCDCMPLAEPTAVARYLALRFSRPDQEVVGALFLDLRSRLLGEREVFRGSLSRVAVEPRPILREALVRSAAGVVLFHTHPSGDASPSAEDLAFTKRFGEAGEIVGIRLVDHLVLGSANQLVSLRQRGGW